MSKRTEVIATYSSSSFSNLSPLLRSCIEVDTCRWDNNSVVCRLNAMLVGLTSLGPLISRRRCDCSRCSSGLVSVMVSEDRPLLALVLMIGIHLYWLVTTQNII